MVEGRQVYGKGKRHVILGRGKRAYPTLPYPTCSALLCTDNYSVDVPLQSKVIDTGDIPNETVKLKEMCVLWEALSERQ